MRQLVVVPTSLRLLVGAIVTLALGLAIGIGVNSVLASSPPTTVSACVSKMSGFVRIVSSDRYCMRTERFMTWQSGADLSGVEARLTALEGLVTTQQATIASQQATIDDLTAQVPACLSTANDGTALFSGCNVQIINGQGSTATVNGKGNLIVGYNEDNGDTRTGSHNVVVGSSHTYSSYGGLVAGYDNIISGDYASVSGGEGNTASGHQSSVSGGYYNTASDRSSSVSGGYNNTASGDYSSVSGGYYNTTTGDYSSVSGGAINKATGIGSSVSGGQYNTASGIYSTVSGGLNNTASGMDSSVSGGSGRSASGNGGNWRAGNLFEAN
ncbi:MAG TPA: hypothetical protein PL172_09840 [Thermomicrobiales bacterium]|nr:hypothetical protein [Thermomicrobiales bacterium]